MTRLDCNVIGCTYNEDNCCKRNEIRVAGEDAVRSSETCCDSFFPRGSGSASNSFGTPEKNTEVSCDALECVYNHRNNCRANHIGISGSLADSRGGTECASFMAG